MALLVMCGGLMLVCTIYAVVLHHIRRYYEPNWTWVTVVIGDALILGALAALEAAGTPLTALAVLAAMASAGTPIILWQVLLYVTRHGRNGHRS